MSDDEIREIYQACHERRAFIDPDKVLLIIWELEHCRTLLRIEKRRVRRQQASVMEAMKSKVWKRAKRSYQQLRDVACGKI